ncbi:hypothetical protein AIT68_003621 [Salmonella enterica subsp. salamae]|uniref:hypothetical protein n=1 Tax=Salmonella enterica TaxID=28901 RepID=UPI0009E7D1AF|nr:hypothetical protein [Salmonella enterica]EBQ5244405.1 hypothetical protein [Salmonella enterica subsp. salamae]
MRKTKRKEAILAMYAPRTLSPREEIRLLMVAGKPPFDVACIASFLYGEGTARKNPTLYRSLRRTLEAMVKAGQLERVKAPEKRFFGLLTSHIVRYALPGTCAVAGETSPPAQPDTDRTARKGTATGKGGYSPGYDPARGVWRL